MTLPALTRRGAILAGATLAFAGAAHAATGGKKLVVIIARGGMDGLSVAPPTGDRAYAGLRGQIAIPADQALKLDGDFGLHPKLTTVHALALKGQARIAPAVAIPDNVRSHFEAQDILESGGNHAYGASSGWLNRTLGALSDRKVQGLSIGAQAPLILRGPVQAASWSPGGVSRGPRLQMILSDLYRDDPLLSKAFASGLQTEAMAAAVGAPMGAGPRSNFQNAGQGMQFGAAAARFMIQDGGPQIVALSIDGWDTHANQGAAEGQLANRLAVLDAVIGGLSSTLGPEWNNTVVLVVTEFGRTARINGTRGTDHGTASTALVLGGGLKPGGIIGDWPTLAESKLYQGRDLAPTMDIRSLFKSVLFEHVGVARRDLDTKVFPDSGSLAIPSRIV